MTPTESQNPVSTENAGEAVYPGKEAWKSEPGNRYTAEELREMERKWKIRISDPDVLTNCFQG
jgi:hypothetical protein